MDQQIFTVYDSAAEVYLEPFFAQSRGAAVRSFTDALNASDHPFAQHPADYTLFHLGTYCQRSGTITVDTRTSLGNGLDFKSRPMEAVS